MIEFLCTVAGLIAGVAIAASLIAARQELGHLELESQLDKLDTEKMQGVALQLQSLSERVFSDVNAHSAKVASFTSSLTETSESNPVKLWSAIDEIISANKEMQGMLADAQKQIAEQSQIIQETTHQARTDTLTELANRRALDEFLANCLQNDSDGHTIGLMLLDIDRFKSFNDTYGHLTGDAVLKCFARSVAEACGPSAYPARYGGEEFAVVLKSQSTQEVVEHAARIRQFASQQKIYHEDLELSITASAGLILIATGDDIGTAYEKSDEGLYKSKQNGRNQGFWLSDQGWEPFPQLDQPVAAARVSEQVHRDSVPEDIHQTSTSSPEPEENENQDRKQAGFSDGADSFLELSVFVDRVSEQLGHLHGSGLPATCMMIEYVPLGSNSVSPEAWHNTASIVESKMRGIDLTCIYRPSTACVFMPGCSAEAAIQKACDLLLLLNSSITGWDSQLRPSHFAIAVGHALDSEDATPLLDRIEQALDEAHDASPNEIVVHSGHSTYFQQV